MLLGRPSGKGMASRCGSFNHGIELAAKLGQGSAARDERGRSDAFVGKARQGKMVLMFDPMAAPPNHALRRSHL